MTDTDMAGNTSMNYDSLVPLEFVGGQYRSVEAPLAGFGKARFLQLNHMVEEVKDEEASGLAITRDIEVKVRVGPQGGVQFIHVDVDEGVFQWYDVEDGGDPCECLVVRTVRLLDQKGPTKEGELIPLILRRAAEPGLTWNAYRKLACPHCGHVTQEPQHVLDEPGLPTLTFCLHCGGNAIWKAFYPPVPDELPPGDLGRIITPSNVILEHWTYIIEERVTVYDTVRVLRDGRISIAVESWAYGLVNSEDRPVDVFEGDEEPLPSPVPAGKGLVPGMWYVYDGPSEDLNGRKGELLLLPHSSRTPALREALVWFPGWGGGLKSTHGFVAQGEDLGFIDPLCLVMDAPGTEEVLAPEPRDAFDDRPATPCGTCRGRELPPFNLGCAVCRDPRAVGKVGKWALYRTHPAHTAYALELREARKARRERMAQRPLYLARFFEELDDMAAPGFEGSVQDVIRNVRMWESPQGGVEFIHVDPIKNVRVWENRTEEDLQRCGCDICTEALRRLKDQAVD